MVNKCTSNIFGVMRKLKTVLILALISMERSQLFIEFNFPYNKVLSIWSIDCSIE
jgi:hypothetical protein